MFHLPTILRVLIVAILAAHISAAEDNQKSSSSDSIHSKKEYQKIKTDSNVNNKLNQQKRGLYDVEPLDILHAPHPSLLPFAHTSVEPISAPLHPELHSIPPILKSVSPYPEVIIGGGGLTSTTPIVPISSPAVFSKPVPVDHHEPPLLVPDGVFGGGSTPLPPTHKEITITKEVPIPYYIHVDRKIHYPIYVKVPQPYPVTVEKRIPYEVRVPVDRPVPFAVPKPYPVKVEKHVPYPVRIPVDRPYPVHIPVEKHVPYPVEVVKEVPVKVPVDRPYPVHVPVEKPVPYPVEKHVPYAVHVPVDRPYPVPKPYPVPVEKHVPYPVIKRVPYPVKVPVEVPVKVPYPVEVKVPYKHSYYSYPDSYEIDHHHHNHHHNTLYDVNH